MKTTVTPLTQGAAEFVTHIHRLPIELLQHLLSLAVAEIRHGKHSWHLYYRRIVELRLVSTRWLAAIDSHPSFWTLLTNRLNPSLLSTVLEKSGTLPLDVDVYLLTPEVNLPPDYMNTVTRLAERWRSLNIRWFHPEHRAAFQKLLLTPAPQLKAFSFEGFDDILRTISLFDNIAPNLDSISTRLFRPNWEWFLMKGLRKLAVSTVSPDVRDFEGLVRVLVASPNMEELEIHEWRVRRGTLLGEPSPKLEPIVLDSLRLLTLRVLPSPWDYKLLEAIRIPQRCAVNIAFELNPWPQAPLSEPMKHLQARLTGSWLLKVDFAALQRTSRAEYKCLGIDGVGDTSISLRIAESADPQLSDAFLLWLSSLAEITESVQTSGIPVDISIFSDHPLPHPSSPDTLTSTLKSVDELLPSVYKANIAGSAAEPFLIYASSPSFPNLSVLEVSWVKVTPWKEILGCVSARSELATARGWKFKPLRLIALPHAPIDEDVHERLSALFESIVYLN